jgi:solute carrier family 25 protein 38
VRLSLTVLFPNKEYARSNIPGIALYMTGLNQARGFMAVSPFFATVRKHDPKTHSSVLPVLTSSGNLLAGATTRVAVGFVLNPFSVLKARYEVSTTFLHHPFYAL